jgi:excisionase family DNA binding protein
MQHKRTKATKATKATKNTYRKLFVSRGKDTLTCREIAFESGLGLETIYDAIRRGELPYVKIGKRQIVSRVNYHLWLSNFGRIHSETRNQPQNAA